MEYTLSQITQNVFIEENINEKTGLLKYQSKPID